MDDGALHQRISEELETLSRTIHTMNDDEQRDYASRCIAGELKFNECVLVRLYNLACTFDPVLPIVPDNAASLDTVLNKFRVPGTDRYKRHLHALVIAGVTRFLVDGVWVHDPRVILNTLDVEDDICRPILADITNRFVVRVLMHRNSARPINDTCPVCLEIIHKSYVTGTCGHGFCRKCAQGWIITYVVGQGPLQVPRCPFGCPLFLG